MKNNRGEYPISFILLISAVILESTLLYKIKISNVIPDLSLIVLVYIAYRKGSMTGQVTGFVTGITEDILSLSPMGLNAFIKTFIGYIYGIIQGNVFVDPLLMPIILVAVATLIKALLLAVLGVVFPIPQITTHFFTHDLWISILYNSLLAPFLFALLNLIKVLKPGEKEIR
ncbi:MAG: rod shape-determining protein MreD [Spirochaetales bacterium]|nr:rod shape-determining protein MreD [Spirochaetales bacterium]RKX85506.1 MAG: rod shape-determining protein MreD [Spirochaetota bacterium]